MKVRISEATGPVLDWMVAKVEYTDRRVEMHEISPAVQVENSPGSGDRYCIGWFSFRPSTDWSQGGPIKTAARIGTLPNRDGNGWEAGTAWEFFESESFAYHRSNGETELIAAMRCRVTSKLGDEVDVPEELL